VLTLLLLDHATSAPDLGGAQAQGSLPNRGSPPCSCV